MKKEYQYLVLGAVLSAAVLMGMGIAGDEKQVTEGRYQYIDKTVYLYSTPVHTSGQQPTNVSSFLVIDTQTGTVNLVGRAGESIVFPFAATKAE